MKFNRFLLYIGIFLLKIVVAESQITYFGDINLNGQNQVDSFPINFPTVSRIVGSLTIENVTDIDSLYNLHTISNHFDLNGNFSNLEGLNNIDSVGHFSLYTNNSTLSCNGLENLEFCNSLRINGNNTSVYFGGLGDVNLKTEMLRLENLVFYDFYGITSSSDIKGINIIGCQFVNFNGLQNLDSLNVLAIQTGSSFNGYQGFYSLEHIGLFLVKNSINPITFYGLSTVNSINEIEFQLAENSEITGLNNLDYTKLINVEILNLSVCSSAWLCDYFNNNGTGYIYGPGNCYSVPIFLQSCNVFTYSGVGTWSDNANWSPTYPGFNISNATLIVEGNLTVSVSENIECNNCSIINNGSIIIEGVLNINN